jgi:hypothetical protein
MKTKQPRKRRKRPYFAATRQGKARTTLPMHRAVHKELKRLALDLDLTLEGVVHEAVIDMLKRHGRPTPPTERADQQA